LASGGWGSRQLASIPLEDGKTLLTTLKRPQRWWPRLLNLECKQRW
jgi:hypothetical protein